MADDLPVGPAERPDADDYDLLTYGEAGARLVEEIARERRRLDQLQAAGADGGQLASVRQRIGDLQEAADRQKAAAAERADFQSFFGYDPKAVR
ncbi:MAG TPA: hypothetical protein VHZ03_00245 [Trebonia sp.]|nr:hypothetical protein [Trebonia sp.]